MRKQITDFLRKTLIHTEFSGIGKYYASEVTIDYGTSKPKRVDFMQFLPPAVVFLSNIEKGIFICYEVKSCIQDIYSGKGLNFYGEKNYIVTTMETYKKLQPDIISGKLDRHIRTVNAENSLYYGIMMAVPEGKTMEDEHEKPTSLDADCLWTLRKIVYCHEGPRKRSMTELLFCMLRSGA